MLNLDQEIFNGRNLTRGEALALYAVAADPAAAEPLFTVAAKLRDRVFGNAVHFMATMAPILACALTPRCEYCDWWRAQVIQRSRLAAGAVTLAKKGVQRILLVGGSRDGDYDNSVFDIVQRIRDEGVDVDIEINVGGCLTASGLKRLRTLGVVGVTASLETVNEELFRRHKPGDSLNARRQLLADAQHQGFELRSIMMIGLGESDADRIDHLLELRAHAGLRHLMVSRFSPRPNTPLEHREQTTMHDWARTVAMARLILPRVRIGFAGGVDHVAELPLWYRAGGGNQLFAMGVHTMEPPPDMRAFATEINDRLHLIDRRPVLMDFLNKAGLQPTFDDMRASQ